MSGTMPRYDPTIPLAEAVQRVFAGPSRASVHTLLDEARGHDGHPFGERVRLACVLLSAGNIGDLRHYLRQAGMDSRDVLYWAFEYDDAAPEHMRAHLVR